MAQKRATPGAAQSAESNDSGAPGEIAGDRLSGAFMRQAELPPNADQDDRFVRLLSIGSIPELSVMLNKLKSEKYQLLTRFPDLQQLPDVHPQRHRLTNRNRRIRLCEEAIRVKAESALLPSFAGRSDAAVQSIGEGLADVTDATTARRRHGPAPDMESHRKVAEVVQELGPNWKEDVSHLCERLDQSSVPVSRDWKKKGWASWADACDESRENVVKAVDYRIEMASRQSIG